MGGSITFLPVRQNQKALHKNNQKLHRDEIFTLKMHKMRLWRALCPGSHWGGAYSTPQTSTGGLMDGRFAAQGGGVDPLRKNVVLMGLNRNEVSRRRVTRSTTPNVDRRPLQLNCIVNAAATAAALTTRRVKNMELNSCPYLHQILAEFHNSFTDRLGIKNTSNEDREKNDQHDTSLCYLVYWTMNFSWPYWLSANASTMITLSFYLDHACLVSNSCASHATYFKN